MLHMKFNIKLTIILFFAAIALGVGVHTLHRYQVQRRASGLLARAARAEADGQIAQAQDYYTRYLVLRPDDVEALARYAELLDRSNDTPAGRAQAFRVYRKAVQLAGERSDLRRRMIDLGVRSDDYSEIRAHVEVLLRQTPKDSELLYLLGRCEESAGRSREAAEAYEKARKIDPSRIEVYTRLAELLRRQLHSPEKADAVMDAQQERDGVVVKNPTAAAAYLARARYRQRYATTGVDPATDVARALALAPDDADALLAAAATAREKGDIEVARGHLGKAIKKHPNNLTIYEAMAGLELKDGRASEASDWLRKGFEMESLAHPGARAGIGWLLADTLITLNRFADADKVLEKLRGMNVRPELLGYLEARELVSQGKWGRGATALQTLAPKLTSQPELKDLAKRALCLLGRCYERLENTDQRLSAYQKAVSIELDTDNLWAEARLGVAASLVDLNRLGEALEQYRIVQAKQPDVGLLVARVQIAQNLRLTAAERRWNEVERTLGALEKLSKEGNRAEVARKVAVLRAEVLVAREQIGPARQLLEAAVQQFPKDVDLRVALANLATREGKPERALATLDDARGQLGDRVELRIARIAGWVAQGGEKATDALEAIEHEADSLPTDDRSRLWRDLADGYTRLGQPVRAADLWRRLAAERPDDLSVRLRLFDHAVTANDEVAAGEVLKEIQRIEGEGGPLGHYAKAMLLIRRAQREPKDRNAMASTARSELERTVAQRPSWSRAVLALGDAEALLGDSEAALQSYEKAILQMGERDPAVVARVLQTLSRRGRLSEAAQIVQKLREERLPLSGDLQKLVATVSHQNGDPARALELAKSVVSADSKNPEELIWLGQIQWAAGQPAEATLRRAVALANDSPKAWLALVLYLAGTGQTTSAEEAIRKAEQALPREQSTLVLAQCYEAIGRQKDAESLYQKARDAQPDDIPTLRAVVLFQLRAGRTAEAESTLQRIIELGGTSADAAWARRSLASVMAAGGDYLRSTKGLALLGPSSEADSRTASPDDVRTKARILAARPNRPSRREAIALIEGLTQRGVAEPQDLLLLASLYEADGNWPKARDHFLGLVTAARAYPEALAQFIRALLRHDGAVEAAVYLAKLEPLVPGKAALAELKARVLIAKGNADEAVALLKSFAQEDTGRLLPAAMLLEELKQTSPAEALYREYVERFQASRPAAVLTLAAFLGRQGRTKEALDLAEASWEKCPAEAISQTCVRILYGNKGDAALDERVARRLEETARARPDSVSIQFDLANVRILQGRYADAEAIFQSIYDRDNTVSAPLNNLAWLLALRGGAGADRALTLIGQAVKRSGETPNLLDTRALAHIAKGQADTAIAELEDAIAVTPTAMEYLHLARAYQMKGRTEDATHAAEKAKGMGLTVGALHPLEREQYGPLLSRLK